jgi:hypothetical protein
MPCCSPSVRLFDGNTAALNNDPSNPSNPGNSDHNLLKSNDIFDNIYFEAVNIC